MATSPLVHTYWCLWAFGLHCGQPTSKAPKVKADMLRHININHVKKNMVDWYSHLLLKYLPQ